MMGDEVGSVEFRSSEPLGDLADSAPSATALIVAGLCLLHTTYGPLLFNCSSSSIVGSRVA